MEEDREINLMKYYFQQCRQDGYLIHSIIKIIKSSLSPSQFKDISKDRLIFEKDHDESELGQELWSQNNDNDHDVSLTTQKLPRKRSRDTIRKKQKQKKQTARPKRYNSK